MAVVDPYAPCPCGSGQKFKWCCQKVEAVADRAHRLFEGGQIGGAVEALDDGLRKNPGNAWLLTRKALYLLRAGRPDAAKAATALVLKANPGHAGGLTLMTRLALEGEGPAAGAAQLQQALSAFPADRRRDLAPLVRVVSAFLVEAGEYPAALKHLRLAQSLLGAEAPDSSLASTLRSIETNPSVSPYQKNDDRLSPAPVGSGGSALGRFNEALGWAGEGLWASAASAFETLTGDPSCGAAADRNAGFCRLWMADSAGAVAALRRYAARLGPTAEAVDVEALCQQTAVPAADELVEQVQLIWPIRDRAMLLAALDADPAVHPEPPAPIDPDDPQAPEVDQYTLLDRPAVDEAPAGLTPKDIPRVVGRLFVGQEIVALEAYDDGRLDALSHRFTALAVPGIPPAHPKTKLIDRVPRLQVALMWEWLLPNGLDAEQARRLTRLQSDALINDVWPETPNPALRGRSPSQAARAGDAEVPLRAALLQLGQDQESLEDGLDVGPLRARLHVPAEPAVDPSADIDTLHLARLTLVDAEALADGPLARLYRRARGAMLQGALDRAGRALAARPGSLAGVGVDVIELYSDLAAVAATRGHRDEAFDMVRRGRQAEPAADKARNAAAWDVFEVRLRTRFEPPQTWVPELAVVLDRYGADPQASQTVMLNLVEMGLVEVVPAPDRPGELMIDPRTLQALLAQYGPRVTTASGRLGVSATKPEIWTPGAGAGGGGGAGGGLWTPGSASPKPPAAPAPGSGGAAAPAAGPSKLILPGR